MGKTNITLEMIKEELYNLNPNLIILSDSYTSWYDDIQVQCKLDNHIWTTKWANIKRHPFSCNKCKENNYKKYIVDYVVDSNYKFINFDVFNFFKSVIIVQCNNHHEPYKVAFKDFKSGKRCRKCWNEQFGVLRSNPIEKVLNNFKKESYEVLEGIDTYKNAKSNFIVKCENGHISNMSYYQLLNTNGCTICNDYIAKYTYEQINNIFDDCGCCLLTSESDYINSHQKLHYKCVCGNDDYDNIYTFRERHCCRRCAGYNIKLSKTEVEDIFKERNCVPILHKDYYTKSELIDYTCVCGNKTHTNIIDFYRIQGCTNCYNLRRSGENSSWWNPNLTDEERLDNRKYLEYKEWRKEVYERDNYTCQCCGDDRGGNLNAHHLDGYSWCKERRLDVSNGVTLCENCHSINPNSFHKQYGFYNNTELQFIEWINQNKLINYKHCISL